MMRRLVSMLLILSMIFTLLPIQAFAADAVKPVDTANPFEDVEQGSLYYDAVQYVRMNGLFNGTSETTFWPDGTMTRGMFVAVLGRMAGVDPDNYSGASDFTDVPESAYYAPYVAWAAKYGVTRGTENKKFSPDTYIDRQQMVTFFVRYFELFGVNYETNANITTTPGDIDSVSPWARDAVLKLWRTGLLNGDGTNFNPVDNASRAQVAIICYRTDEAVDTWYSEPGVPSTRVRIDPATGLPYGESKKPSTPTRPFWPPASSSYSVSFYDGSRLIKAFTVQGGEPLGQLPSVGESSKAGCILEGYYTDPGFTTPFYAENPVTGNMNVYAKYEEMVSEELLTIDSFARMDQDKDVSFRFKPLDGTTGSAAAAVTLTVKDGSDPVEIAVEDNGDGTYTVYAPAGFNAGCSYELTVAKGWSFLPDGSDAIQNDAIRTAAFSIEMAEVENLSMSDGIKYIKDTDQINYTYTDKDNNSYSNVAELPSNADFSKGGSFNYDDAGSLQANDILCIYVGGQPDTKAGSAEPTKEAVYAKVTEVDNATVKFAPLGENDRSQLYEVPDNLPLMVDELPSGDTGTVSISKLDTALYTQMVGADKGTLANANEALGIGDFVTLYTSAESIESEHDVYFGRVTEVNGETITYEKCTAEDIEKSGDLYKNVGMSGEDLISPEEKSEIERTIQAQVEASSFGEDTAYMLLSMATQTDGFQNSAMLQDFMIQDAEGNPLPFEYVRTLAPRNVGTKFELSDDVEIKVELVTSGDQLHYKNKGVQLAIGIEAEFEVDTADDGKVHINLSATFVQEVAVDPKVKGELVYKKILKFIPVPTGVKVNAIVDVKSFTAMSIKAEIYTEGPEDKNIWEKFQDFAKDPTALGDIPGLPDEIKQGMDTVGDALKKIDGMKEETEKKIDDLPGYENYISAIWEQINSVTNGEINEEEWEELGEHLKKTDITAELMNLMNLTSETDLSTEYIEGLSDLMDRYSELLEKETDWVQLVEQEMFNAHTPEYYGVMIGVQGKFVVRADLNLAIGSNLQYEVGKRYNFWFRVGLFKPTSGSSTMDLIDESFAFQFYVMGKLGIKTGVRLKIYAAVGSVDAISVGITTELGPYLKLWGFFIYDYSKLRKANTLSWSSKEQMAGALYLEFGLYLMAGVEAKALFLEFDKDFVDKEFPLLDAGSRIYYYGTAYEPLDETDEIVVFNDGSADLQSGCAISMLLPEDTYALRAIDLTTGKQSTRSLSFDNYTFKVSNPNFRVDNVNGKPVISVVSIPKNVRLMQCDLTITYKHGKLAFSTYDMSATVHLVWTNMTAAEYQQVYTASVVIPDGNGGMEAVWSKRVRKGTHFDLPTEDEIRQLLSWTDAKYIAGAGYGRQQTEGITLIQNQQYTYDLGYQTYCLTVNGIEDGTGSRTFTAKYGEPFDFSALMSTGANGPDEYTRFAGLTLNGESIDLSKPVTGSFAESVRTSANAQATAEYVDDSVTAAFTFTGLDHEDIEVRLRRGRTPDTTAVEAAVPDYLYITGYYPAIGPMDGDMTYQVVCNAAHGSTTITFNSNGGSEVADISKPLDGVLGTLPTPTKAGHIFAGWFTDDETFQKPVDANTVVTGEMTLYAKWEVGTMTVTFNTNSGLNLRENTMTVTYGLPYGDLPIPERSGYGFRGWHTEMEGGTEVTADTGVETTEDHTLYDHWAELEEIPASVFDFGAPQIATYDRMPHPVEYTFTPGDGESYTEDSFTLIYAGTSDAGGSTEAPIKAGTYKVIVTRPADERYNAFEEEYDDVLVIKKATRDLRTAVIDADNSIRGFNYLSVGASIDDLGPGAKVSVSMEVDGRKGISTNDERCFVYSLSADTEYTLIMTSLSVTNDPNYEDATGAVRASASLATTSTPSGTFDGDTSWYSSSASSFTLTTAEQMFGLASLIRGGNTFEGKTVTLGDDVDLSGYEWNALGTFKGVFNGQSHKIYGLYINQPSKNNVGMFGYLGGSARIEKVLLAGGEVRGKECVGGIAGQAGPGACIDGCVSFAKVYASGGSDGYSDAGGIVGKSDKGTVINCVNYGSVSGGKYHIGGIVGYNVNKAKIENCANLGAVSGSSACVGGIAGENNDKDSKIYNCVNVGPVTGTSSYRGAIVGRNHSNLGNVDQGYYLKDSAPGRKAAGAESSAANDSGDNRKCTSFERFDAAPAGIVEDSCSSSMTLLEVLNHWVNRCGSKYSEWKLSGPGGAPIPDTAARL